MIATIFAAKVNGKAYSSFTMALLRTPRCRQNTGIALGWATTSANFAQQAFVSFEFTAMIIR